MADSAEQYRKQANEIAALAERAEDPTVRTELLALAERFRRLADYIAIRQQGPGSGATLSFRRYYQYSY